MWQMILNELTQATLGIIHNAAEFVPRFVVMLIIVLIGWLIAALLRTILRSILRVTKFDKLSEDAGATQLLKKAALPPTSELLSRFVFWVAWLGFILVGVSVLQIVGLEEHVARFFGFLPRLFAALFVFFFGLLAASFFSRATLLAAVNADLPSPRLISTTVRTLIIIFSLSVGFEELGIGENTVIVTFGIVFGALMLGLALAFGLGGRDLARQYLERRFVHDKKKEEKQDELSPL
jgi:Mechanosensitive ion channel, conserved TM helix